MRTFAHFLFNTGTCIGIGLIGLIAMHIAARTEGLPFPVLGDGMYWIGVGLVVLAILMADVNARLHGSKTKAA